MKIKRESSYIFFLFFIALMPEIFTQIKPIFYICSLLAILEFGYFIFYFKKNAPIYLLIWLGTCGYLLIAMILNENIKDIDQWGKTTIFVSDIILLLNYYVKKEKSRQLIAVLSILGIFYFALNGLVILMFPNGLIHTVGGNYYFLGTRNSILKFFVAFLSIIGLESIYTNKKKRLYIFLVLSIGQILYFSVSTAITCCFIIAFLLLFYKVLDGKINLKLILISTTLISLAFVFLNASSLFAWFITNVLQKDVGLNSRSLIWSKAIQILGSDRKLLFLGHGIQNDGNFIYLYQLYWPAHNQLLEWLYEFGILGISLLYSFFLNLEIKKCCGFDVYFIYIVIFSIFIGSISSGPLSAAPGYLPLCLLPHILCIRRSFDYK